MDDQPSLFAHGTEKKDTDKHLEAAGRERKTLRDHQRKAMTELRASIASGNKRVVIQAPTGFGKTLLAQRIMEGAISKGNPALFTVPMITLVGQTVDAFEAEGIDPSYIGVMQADHPRTNPEAMIQIASLQTLLRRDMPKAAVVVVDECHLRSQVIDDMMETRRDLIFVGLSATPWAKGMGLKWDDLVVPCTIKELIAKGYLSRFKVFAPDDPDMTGVKTVSGDFSSSGSEKVMSKTQIVGSVVQTWLEKGENRPTLLFGVNRAHAKSLSEAFERAGVATAYCDANTDRVERDWIAQQFRSGEVKIACSVRTLTTGVDWPVSCIIDAAPTKSEMLHVQKIGRGLRVNEGTEDLIVLDHAGNSLRLGLVTDIHHTELDATPPGERATAEKKEKLPTPCPNCTALMSGLLCASCGYEKTMGNGKVHEKEGELVQLGYDDRAEDALRQERLRFFGMATGLARMKGNPKIANRMFKDKYGDWPDQMGLPRQVPPITPDDAFMRYEKSRRIAWAKRREKEERMRKQGAKA